MVRTGRFCHEMPERKEQSNASDRHDGEQQLSGDEVCSVTFSHYFNFHNNKKRRWQRVKQINFTHQLRPVWHRESGESRQVLGNRSTQRVIGACVQAKASSPSPKNIAQQSQANRPIVTTRGFGKA